MIRFLLAIFALQLSCRAQDITIADFEGSDYGDWTTTGTAFGSGPQSGIAKSDNGGDAATGTLTSPKFTIERDYINFLVSGGNWPDDVNVELIVSGTVVRTAIANHQDNMFWFTWDVLDLLGSSATIVVNDNYTGNWGRITVDDFEQSDTRRGMDELYRPQFHISAQWNHINDPDGLVYYDGEYHVFHQWSPFTLNHGKKHWGHLVSTDLIHWKHLPYALTPTEGWGKGGCAAYSGSAVVDENNTAGFQTGDEQPIVAIWTAIGCGQYIAYSNDRGRNFTWYEGNPVIPQHKDDRDPMVRWHEPTRKWVMALPETREEGRILAFYVSDDLKKWTRTATVNGVGDCPDYYKLPVDGNPDNEKWILYGGRGGYRFGEFDGTTFIDEGGGGHSLWKGNQYATQTFDNTPDGRKIMMVWVVDNEMPPGMPYSQMLSFPVEIKLKTFPEGVRAAAAPIQEIELLHDTKHSWSDETIGSGGNLLSGLSGQLFDIRAEFEIGTASEFGFRIRGMGTVSYNVNNSQARLNGNITKNNDWNMAPDEGRVKMQILVDRSIIEAFFDEGRAYLMSTFFPHDSDQSLEIFSAGGDTKLVSMDVYELKSSWDHEQSQLQ